MATLVLSAAGAAIGGSIGGTVCFSNFWTNENVWARHLV